MEKNWGDTPSATLSCCYSVSFCIYSYFVKWEYIYVSYMYTRGILHCYSSVWNW